MGGTSPHASVYDIRYRTYTCTYTWISNMFVTIVLLFGYYTVVCTILGNVLPHGLYEFDCSFIQYYCALIIKLYIIHCITRLNYGTALCSTDQ